jgi:hypothetical protein
MTACLDWIGAVAAPAKRRPAPSVAWSDSVALRRAVGVLPWVALEVLANLARDVDGELLAEVSVRALAAELGVAKNTAARGLAVLRARGVVAMSQRRTTAGRFGPPSYTILAARDLTAPAPRSSSSSVTPASPRRRRPITTQLSLLPAD